MALKKLSHQQATALADKGAIDPTQLSAIWQIVRPFVIIISKIPFIGKNVRKYINLFVGLVDGLVANEGQ